MGAGYTRQSETNIVDEAVINADDFNAEFDAIESAFNATTGHTHDGTEGEGPQIDTAGLADDAVTGAKIDSTTTVTAASFVGPLTGDVTGNVTGDVTGNADTATAFETARTIAGQSFDGTANISIAPGDLTGVTVTATEINYLDGATSNIQDQIDNIPTSGFVTGSSSGDVTGRIPVFTDDTGFAIQSSDASGAPDYLRVNNGYLAVTSTGVTLGNYVGGPESAGTSVIRIGNDAGDNASGTGSIYISGLSAGREATGSYNIGMGYFALYDSNFTGDHNIALGQNAGYSIESGDNNICIGRYAGFTTLAPSGSIGGTDSNIICLGDNNIAEAYIAVAWTVPSDARDKTDFEDLNVGLNFINRVEPKTFHYDHRSAYYVFDENNEIVSTPTPDGTHKTDQKFLGFSAQQVQEAVEASGLPDQIIIDTSDPDAYKMKETAFIPVLVKAVQELSARVEQLEDQLNNT